MLNNTSVKSYTRKGNSLQKRKNYGDKIKQQINTSLVTGVKLSSSTCFSPSVVISKYHHKQLAFCWQDQQYTLTVLPQGHINTSALYHSPVYRQLSVDVLLIHHTDDIMLVEPIIVNTGHIGKAPVGLRVRYNPTEMQGAAIMVRFLRVQCWRRCQDIPSKVKHELLLLPIGKRYSHNWATLDLEDSIHHIWTCYSKPLPKWTEKLPILSRVQNRRLFCNRSTLPSKLLCHVGCVIQQI